MRYISFFVLGFVLKLSFLSAATFTISSYNCGSLSDHYDYLRAVTMEKLMQERYIAEPTIMALNEKLQNIALKIVFAPDSLEKTQAQREWREKHYKQLFQFLTQAPTEALSPNTVWNQKAEEMITSYKVRPILIHDETVNQMLDEHLNDLCKTQPLDRQEKLEEARAIMAKRIFAQMQQDLICLQEADYLKESYFPPNYQLLLTQGSHSKNGIAWNQERFELITSCEVASRKAILAYLRDKETGKVIAIASGHLTGCNPYRVEKDPLTGDADSSKGDQEVQKILHALDAKPADLKIVGIDSNVTALHPRLQLLKKAGYRLDYQHYLEPTCTNPHQILNTRIDWILIKSHLEQSSIINIPVLSVGLNSTKTNMSDHKPIAAKISYL